MTKRDIPKGKVTIDDIAAEAGVSIASVSRVLNQADGVGAATRKRILEVVKRLNYHPNLHARGLAANKPNAIGIVITRVSQFAFSNPYYAETLKGIESRTRESDQYLVFSFSGDDRDRSYTQMVHQHLAAGLIVLGNRIGDPWLKEAVREKVPLILIPGDPTEPAIPSVDFDNVDAGAKSVEHLADLGHRKIGLINGSLYSKYSADRLKGFQAALRKRRLPVRKQFIAYTDFTPESAYQAMKALLALSDRPTAVLIVNDHCSLGALKAAREMNCRVPQDISIVGSGDVQFTTMASPPLTTIREPFYEIGWEAADRLLRIIGGQELSESQLILPAELVVRSSTAPPS
jgi:LacI family transcriptional regulator